MIKNKALFVFSLFIGVISLAIFFFFYVHYSPHTVRKKVGFQKEAKINSFLAAELFTQKFKNNSDSHAIFDFRRDAHSQILVMPFMALPEGSSWEDLKFLIEDGAILVTGNFRNHHTSEALPAESKRQFFNIAKAEADEETNIVGEITINQTTYEADFNLYNRLEVADVNQTINLIKKDNRTLAYSLPYGAGQVWVWNDLSIFQNKNLDKFDHADLLWHMTKDHRSTTFIFAFDHPSLINIIWHKAPLFIILFALLIIVELWHHCPRFGPLIPVKSDDRNRLLEHIYASSLFSLRRGNYDALLKPLQTEVQEKINRQFSNREDGLEHFASEAGIQADQLKKILHQSTDKSSDFIHKFTILKKLTGCQNA